MSKKEDNSKKDVVSNDIQAKAEEAKRLKAEEAEKEVVYKVKTNLGFLSRNYYINNKSVLLEAGKKVSKETYNAFHPKFQEKYFEKA